MKKFFDSKALTFLIGFLYAFFLQKYTFVGIIAVLFFWIFYLFQSIFLTSRKLSGVPKKCRKAVRIALEMEENLDQNLFRYVEVRAVLYNQLHLYLVRNRNGSVCREVHYDFLDEDDVRFAQDVTYWIESKTLCEWTLKKVDFTLLDPECTRRT